MEAIVLFLGILSLLLVFLTCDGKRRRQETIRQLLAETVDKLNEAGIKSCLFYGTLLGWYRDGDVIYGDSDGDLLVPEEDFKRLGDVKGVEVIDDKLARSFTPARDTYIDLYCLYDEGENVRVRTGDCSCVPIPKELVMPFQPSEFLGKKVNIPSRTKEWLEFQYGENFMIPSESKGLTC